ncbi:MAG: SDR family NAD(P)-dependent oxidoreductase [Acidobacteriota bacterium]|nr:SDR family NAD(P)-dependent oxidoreductase [Acidobacteriota bacterium]
MRELRNKVAVVTGAASGIGRAMAESFAAQGMRVVLADIEEGPLAEVAQAMQRSGTAVLPYRLDVSNAAEVEALANAAYDKFGAVHILCNNAGVAGEGVPVWLQTLDAWNWILKVNLFGVIHGIHSFVPRMLAAGEDGHIVNTASVAGHLAGPRLSPYYVSKFGTVAISESLYHDLQQANAKVNVSVLCPGFVRTKIIESQRNRPKVGNFHAPVSPDFAAATLAMMEQGIAPEVVAEAVLQAIRLNQFWIMTHPEYDEAIRQRADGILQRRNPALREAATQAASSD